MERSFRADEASRAGRDPIRACGLLFDGPRGRTLLDAIRARLDRGAQAIILDLSGVPFLDASAIGILLKARAAAVRRGAGFRIAGTAGAALRALRLAGLSVLIGDEKIGPSRLKDAAGQDAPLLLSA